MKNGNADNYLDVVGVWLLLFRQEGLRLRERKRGIEGERERARKMDSETKAAHVDRGAVTT